MQALGMPSRVMEDSPAPLRMPSLSIPGVAQKPSSAKRARSRPRRVLGEVPSEPALEREISESRQAQLQRSQSSVAVVQRPGSFDADVFEVQEAPVSGAAAVWDNIVEVSLSCWLHLLAAFWDSDCVLLHPTLE